MDEGTHFAAPTEGSIVVAEELRRRWGLPHWRFTNSGTESTMDAVHLARGAHRPRHDRQDRGHLPRPPRRRDGLGQAAAGPDGRRASTPTAVPYGLGYRARHRRSTRASCRSTTPSARARARAGRRRRRDHGAGDDEHQHRPAGRRATSSACASSRTQHGVPLIFDEVKTGAAVAAGGATELFGVTPDVVCLAKAICGGLPGGAIGMTDELGRAGRGRPRPPAGHVQRQPAVMAAAQATLLEVLTADAYAQLHARQREADGRLRAHHRRVRPARPHRRHGLEGLRRDVAPSRCASTATTSRRSTTT